MKKEKFDYFLIITPPSTLTTPPVFVQFFHDQLFY